FSFLYHSDLLSKDPLSTIKTPKYEKVIMNTALSDEELQKFLRAALLRDPFHKKYYVMMLFTIETGVRARELISIRRKHIDLNNGTVVIADNTKSSIENVVISKELISKIKDYTSHDEYKKFDKNGDELLYTIDGRPIRYDY